MLDYFFSRTFRSIKYGLSIAGGVACAVVIILGSLGWSTIVIPICGGIALIPMAFIFFENTKVIRDMENLVTQFKDETKELKETNESLKETEVKLSDEVGELTEERKAIAEAKDQLVSENDRLEGLLGQAEINLEQMKSLANDYQKTSESLGENLKKSERNADDLKSQAEELVRIKEEYKSQNLQLKENYGKAEKQLEAITGVKDNYEIQLQELSDNNKELSETSELIKSELNKTQSSYEDAKAALKTLLQTTGVLEDLGNDMVKTEKHTEQNVGMMTKLMNMFGVTRSEELFDKLDKDGNNVLSLDEFVNFILDDNTNGDDNKTDVADMV